MPSARKSSKKTTKKQTLVEVEFKGKNGEVIKFMRKARKGKYHGKTDEFMKKDMLKRHSEEFVMRAIKKRNESRVKGG